MKFENERPSETSGFLLWRTHNLWQIEIKNALKQVDLTHVQFILLAGIYSLQKGKEKVTQVMVSQFVQADINMTSAVLRVLEDKGLLKRKQSVVDRRANSLSLTKSGKALIVRAIKEVEDFEKEFFSKASPVEFSETLKTIIDTSNKKKSLQ